MKATSVGIFPAGLALATESIVFAAWLKLPRLRAGVLGALKTQSRPPKATNKSDANTSAARSTRNSLGGYIGFVSYMSRPVRYTPEERGGQGWIPEKDTAAIIRHIERATAFLKATPPVCTEKGPDG